MLNEKEELKVGRLKYVYYIFIQSNVYCIVIQSNKDYYFFGVFLGFFVVFVLIGLGFEV